MIDFEVTKEETEVIKKIALRACHMAKDQGQEYDLIDAMMDITACHKNDVKLRLEELSQTDDFNFVHDVFGINRHIDRSTGKLKNGFLPRFSQPEEATL